MTSSSAAPRLTLTEPSPYEVFLSFRGEDTRNNFVSHLLSALKDRGIITYYDADNLQNGQTISVELMKAIEESSIAIVVLSKNYASSSWCLKELAKIVERKDKLIIFPIFYDVNPSHVRRIEKSFFKAFSIHNVNFKHEVEMVKSWRAALTYVGSQTGEELRGQNQAACIKKIADKILFQLPLEASHFKESLVGMKSRISDLKILINNNPEEVRFIGFWGMGGLGKSTTARAIFNECESEFDGSCFLQDVRKRKDEMVMVQQQLLSKVLNCQMEGIYDVVEGSSMIRKRLCRKKVLLVVDDVDDIDQLDVLAGHSSWFGKGSRIIITTRNEHLLNDVHERIDISTLNDKDALLLFRLHAFRKEHPDEIYMNLSYQVLRYACGLPLALKVLGAHLRKQKESFWVATLRRLKKIPQKEIISVLQVSFDEGLNRNEQDIFLYIACFFRGEDRDDVMKPLHALYLHPEEGIRVLVQKSLIYERSIDWNGQSIESFEMHDLLQDMGQHIVREKANHEVGRYSHLWLEKDIKNVLLDYMVSVEAKGIFIDDRLYEDVIESKILKEESFMNMKKLRFLQINEMGIRRDKAIDSQFSVQLPNGLMCLYWQCYPGNCLGTHPYMNLVHLEMPSSLIERTPDFNHMPNLEVLYLGYSDNLVHFHPSLGRHIKIRIINLEFCKNLKEFPTMTGMNSLEYLNLRNTGLQSFPEICGSVDSLKKLSLKHTYIEGLPISITYATGLRKLNLSYCGLTTVPELPTSLQILKMPGSRSLTEYPKSFPSHLQTLSITNSKIEKTPDFSHLPNLLELDLSCSQKLSEVHASLGLHKKIESIHLADCKNLCYFPTIVDMRCLETLSLSRTKLQCFPEITGRVDNLTNLYLEETFITTLPQSIGQATGLKWLNINSCGDLVSLPISLQPLEELEILFGTEIYSRKRKEEYYEQKGSMAWRFL